MSTQEFKRRLTAILSADVEGSRLMREDEEATVRTITSYHTAIHKANGYTGPLTLEKLTNIATRVEHGGPFAHMPRCRRR